MNLKSRILIILGLIAASGFALFPRNVKERVKGPNGFVYDTVRRVPLRSDNETIAPWTGRINRSVPDPS